MITLDFENFEDISQLNKLAEENGLTVVKDEVMNFDAAQVMTIIGNTAQVLALLLALRQAYGKNNRVNYHSDNFDQDNLSVESAYELAKSESKS